MRLWKILLIAGVIPVGVLWVGAQDKYKGGPPPETGGNPKFKTDLEFANSLKKDWMKLEAAPGFVQDKTPKPVTMPVAERAPTGDQELQKAIEASKPIPVIPPPKPAEPPPALPSAPQAAPIPSADQIEINFAFFGAPVRMNADRKMRVPVGSSVNNAAIGDWWEAMSRQNYDACLQQALETRRRLNLNDWGYAHLLHRTGEALYNGSPNDANLFTWFMLVKSGYDARIGYNNNQVFLLLPSRNVLYGVPHFAVQKQVYYTATFGGANPSGSLFIYDGNYPEADRPMDLTVASAPVFEKKDLERTVRFTSMGKEYAVTVQYNKPVVDYYDQYPQTDLKVYFASALTPEADQSLVAALKPLVEGKTEAEAVNLLLHFVQSFPYKTDQDQFGREKYFFPEEALYYSYCDCEDRSALFAYLVKRLTGLDVVGLDYPGHVATAVRFSSSLPGDAVTVRNQKYIVCDPTYLGADLGMSQPAYKDVKPVIIEVGA
jgi:hypothetical protein